jgi:hypothetical protein
MRRTYASWLLITAAATSCASAADAALMAFEGTVSVAFIGASLPEVSLTGAGVAEVNSGGADIALNTLRLAGGGIDGTQSAVVTDPEIAPMIDSVQLQAALGAGTLSPFTATTVSQPYLIQNQIPIGGTLRLCLLFAGCPQSLDVPLTANSGLTGLGVGGWIVEGTLSSRLSVDFVPWTVGTAWIPITTASGAMLSLPTVGWVHGPLSFAGSTALTGGALQLVSPMRVFTPLLASQALPVAATLRLRFVPEPGVAWLLGSGAVGLFLIGRKRLQHRGS